MDNGTNSSSNSFNSSSNGTFEGVPPPQPTKSFWTNLLLPALYLIIVAASLYTFSSTYRKRQLAKTAKLEPWFPPHRQRDIYLSLLHLDPSEQASSGDGDSEKKLSRVPDSVLKAALLQRALEDIKRIVQLRQAKPALQTLLQRGSVGDELWQRLLRAEQEMEAEVKDVVNENLLIKQRMAEIQDTLESEKAWWDKKRAVIQSHFMKELEEADGKPAEEAKAADAAPVPNKKNGSSDDDAVIVEAGGPAQAQGGSGKGKKKGKK
ncbi:Translocation protein S66 [Rachicladosporium monterosium]|uniref:Translocation protein S66 n=1 Tax=Rachicladosporium monterosium TaxID=1507873 RepID=A0ABR0KZ14_9PEZI|nr:Translocation protein S66 [Rachicladosporium monterosium]